MTASNTSVVGHCHARSHKSVKSSILKCEVFAVGTIWRKACVKAPDTCPPRIQNMQPMQLWCPRTQAPGIRVSRVQWTEEQRREVCTPNTCVVDLSFTLSLSDLLADCRSETVIAPLYKYRSCQIQHERFSSTVIRPGLEYESRCGWSLWTCA